MAAHGKDDDLPITWPFTFAGLLLTVGLVWFCLGFALLDVKKELPAHYTVFWICIIAAVVITIVAGIYNTMWAKRRREAI
ncbi:MAG: hypothetical protein MUE51_11330 [Thermoleophilia bacterium]|nr:hypothetical protein [Thermoleophilia bacterium]